MAGADSAIRASDAERDAVVETLRRHAADGRLTMEEFEERVAEALAARTRGELEPVLRELPSPPAAPEPRRTRARRSVDWRVVPRMALMAVAVLGAVTLLARGDWWVIFPFFWIVGALTGGGACGRGHQGRDRGRHRAHGGGRSQQAWGGDRPQQARGGRHERDTETVRV